jgi:Fe-Mn family superoxide dismutase
MRFSNIMEGKETLTLVDLPYDYGDLAPVMGKETVKLHYDVLSRGYVDRFNKGEGDPEFNRAGANLHNLFWLQLMKPKVNNQPRGASLELIEKVYGDWIDLRDAMIEEAGKFQGSGWIYMAKDGSIKTLKNQTWRSDVIMPMDVWEHSYLMDYGADRKKYMRNLFRCINWNVINDRLNVGV